MLGEIFWFVIGIFVIILALAYTAMMLTLLVALIVDTVDMIRNGRMY